MRRRKKRRETLAPPLLSRSDERVIKLSRVSAPLTTPSASRQDLIWCQGGGRRAPSFSNASKHFSIDKRSERRQLCDDDARSLSSSRRRSEKHEAVGGAKEREKAASFSSKSDVSTCSSSTATRVDQ